MRQALRIAVASLVSLGCLASTAPAMGDDRSAAQILSEFEAIKIPKLDPAAKGDQKAIAEYRASLPPLLNRKSELILELYKLDPDHPMLPELMNARWRSYGIARSIQAAEFEDVLIRSKNPALRGHAYFWRALARASSAIKDPNQIEAASTAIDAFIDHAPSDPRGASLLSVLAQVFKDSPDQLAKVERRLFLLYPATQQGKSVAGRIRQVESLGRPFELEFTDAIKGSHISMKDFRGKVVVIDFWATWCGPCIADIPRLKKIYEEYQPKGVEFVGISLDFPVKMNGLERLKVFVSKNEVPWPQYYQGDGGDSEFSTSWGINSIPALFVIDQDGAVCSTSARDQLEKTLTELLARKKTLLDR